MVNLIFNQSINTHFYAGSPSVTQSVTEGEPAVNTKSPNYIQSQNRISTNDPAVLMPLPILAQSCSYAPT